MTVAGAHPLGEFLRHNPGFAFDAVGFVESTRYEAVLRERFETFCRTFALAPRPDAGWSAARQAVRALVRDVPAYEGIDWDRERYQDSIPLIDKNTLRAAPDGFVPRAADRERLWHRETSGTTGPPVRIWYAPEFAFDHMLLGIARGLWVAGALTDELRGATVFTAIPVENKYLKDRVWAYPGSWLKLNLQLRFDERRPRSARRLAAVVERHRPAVVGIKPNVLESLLGTARAAGWRGRWMPRAVICSGADLDDGLRREAQAYFGTPVYNNYGLTETGFVAAECARQDGLHLYEHTSIVEVLRGDGSLSTTGKGELVVSVLGNPAMPLLRYRTGDLVEVTDEPCACGVPSRRIRGLSGRVIRNFRLRDGSEFSPFNFNRLFDRFPIREFRLTQTAVDRVVLEVELLPACADPGATLDALRDEVHGGMRGLATVQADRTVFPMDGKFQRYRSLV